MAKDKDELNEEPVEVKQKIESMLSDTSLATDEDLQRLDPASEFKAILKDVGIRRGIDTITETWLGGDIDSPKWTDTVLKVGGIPAARRKLVLMRIFGMTEDQIKELNIASEKDDKETVIKIKETDKTDEDDLENVVKELDKEHVKSLKRQMLEARLMQQMMEYKKALKELNKDDTKTQPMHRTKLVPVLNENGEILKDEQGNPVYQKVIEPVDPSNASALDPVTIMTLMTSMMKQQQQPPQTNSELQEIKEAVMRQMETIKELQHKTELDNLRQAYEKLREEKERELDRLEREYNRRLEEEKNERLRDLTQLKESFERQIQMREQIDKVAGYYNKQLEELKEEIRNRDKDLRSAIVGEITKTASKTTERAADTIDGIVTPLASVMKDMYKTQIDMMRRQAGINPIDVPETSEEELRELI